MKSEEKAPADRHVTWVESWREAVRLSPAAIGLVELDTTCFVELSAHAAELLGVTLGDGARANYLSVTERHRVAAETFRMVRDGIIDGVQGRRRFRRRDGSLIELRAIGWAIRSPFGPDLGLWMASELGSALEESAADVAFAQRTPQAAAVANGARLRLDDRWRIDGLSNEAIALLDRPSAGLLATSIAALTHPGDLASLLFAFARATTNGSAGARVRLRSRGGGWRTVQLALTLARGDRAGTFDLVASEGDSMATDANGIAGDLAAHLRRIATQMEVAGLSLPLAGSYGLRIPAVPELSPRQWDVAARLVRGQRVATIAAEMHLSPSTVRNYLGTIFSKVGVHSQQELLAHWRLDNSQSR